MFYPRIITDGAYNTPGMPGGGPANLAVNPNPLTDPKFKIPGGNPWNKTPLLPGKDTKKFEEAPFVFPQNQLPGASAPIGNVGGLIAQAMPMNAQQLGGQIGMPQGAMQPPNVFSVRPRVSYLEDEGGVDLGGSVNIPIGQEGRVSVQGGYKPETQQLNLQGTIGQPPGTQGLGLDFFVRRTLGNKGVPGMGFPNDLGGQLRYGTQF